VKPLAPHLERVAYLVSLGLSNRAMAERLGLTEGTVAAYVRDARKLVSARNRFELGTWYLRKTGVLAEDTPIFGPS